MFGRTYDEILADGPDQPEPRLDRLCPYWIGPPPKRPIIRHEESDEQPADQSQEHDGLPF